MYVMQINSFQILDAVMARIQSDENFMKLDQSVKDEFRLSMHKNIIYDLVQSALDELFPGPPKQVRKREKRVPAVIEHDAWSEATDSTGEQTD